MVGFHVGYTHVGSGEGEVDESFGLRMIRYSLRCIAEKEERERKKERKKEREEMGT